jgi:hypothetical protein
LSEEAKEIAEADCQQGLAKILDAYTFYLKTRALQRQYLESPMNEQIEMFTWLEDVRNSIDFKILEGIKGKKMNKFQIIHCSGQREICYPPEGKIRILIVAL